MDLAIYSVLRSIVKEECKAGHHWLRASDGAIDITEMKYSQKLFTTQELQHIQKARTLLTEGKLLIPENQTVLNSFQPPDF